MKYSFFILTKMKIVWVIIAFILAVFLHNLIFWLFRIEEPVFFIIAVIWIPAYLLVALCRTFWRYIRKHRKHK